MFDADPQSLFHQIAMEVSNAEAFILKFISEGHVHVDGLARVRQEAATRLAPLSNIESFSFDVTTFSNSLVEMHLGRQAYVAWDLFFDRDPACFSRVLDFLRTGNLLQADGVYSERLFEEFRFYKLSPKPVELDHIARTRLHAIYGTALGELQDLIVKEMVRMASQGRSCVKLGIVSRPYGIGIEPSKSMSACEQLVRVFDVGDINDDMTQVMSIFECREEVRSYMARQGLRCEHGYSPGNIYGSLVPSHAWFVVGIRGEVVERKAKEVATTSETWVPSFLE
uniref:Potassium channel tetramerisation-type BTB domain-containing protein n=1 Tax=Guillardia theta TaxID=55529 RepID=A0A7S4PQX6_GUITH